ncbi:nucleotide sugar dehydrogenase [Haloarchaeobius baliensis]|uniref:nucleotide sugar dehydrogenase n=1 Tax=Haloarchaeobius baliensis TaxID=1670458 RepID=UPI003F885B0F
MALRVSSFEDDLSGLTIAVYGLGKMGLPLASVLADSGASVVGVDIDETIVEQVNDAECPIDGEPQVPELVATHAGDRLTATSDCVDAAERADVMIVLVPTLVDDSGNPVLDAILEAARDISAGVSSGDLVILESTVPPGTTAGPFAEALESETELRAGEDFGIAHCPERTSSGRVVADLTSSYPKIVGGTTSKATDSATAIYDAINEKGVRPLESATAAEAVKVFEGVYRDVNIALANELGKACEEWGLDSKTVFDAANSQPYCDIHVPGVGVGGHCIPVYPHFVMNQASETPLVETARTVNLGMPTHTVDVLQALLAEEGREIETARVLVLGLTYRAGVNELRYAPALEVIWELNERGANVHAHDPLLSADEIQECAATPVADPEGDYQFDGVVLATGHDEYCDLNLGALHEQMRTPTLVDGRRFFETEDLSSFTAAVIGNGRLNRPGLDS